MSCCGGGRGKEWDVKPAQKWDYINLNDFTSTSCFTPISYGILWIMLGVSFACYIADFSTMINLLQWDAWGTNGVQPPEINGSREIPRWVFTGCIILSYVLLAYRWWRAIRAMRSGGVAKSYLDPLAARVQSIRLGNRGRGYRRFLVFAELTKSKHGTEYIALFVYFAFEAWLRIIFAEGPRNLINAYTIYTLVKQWTTDVQDGSVANSGLQNFWAAAIKYSNNRFQTAVFFGMIFTIIIWVISFIGLVIAFILYIMFLWHHIPRQDGGLRGYCKRKVDKSVNKIVSAKIKKALEKEERGLKKESKNRRVLPEAPIDLKRQPTVPVLGDEESAMLSYHGGRPDTPSSILDREPTLPGIGPPPSRPGMPGRTSTGNSNISYGSDAPLLSGAASVGLREPGRSYSPAPGGYPPRSFSPANGRSASPARPFTPTGELVMNRSNTPGTQRSMTPVGGPPRQPMNGPGPQRSYTPAGPPPFATGGRPPGPVRQSTGMSGYSTGQPASLPGQARQLTPGPTGSGGIPRSASAMSGPQNGRSNQMGPPRLNTNSPYNAQGKQSPSPFGRPGPNGARGPGRETPVQEYEMQPQSRQGTPATGGYQAYHPGAQSTGTPATGGYQAYHPGAQSPTTPASADHPLMAQPPMGGMQRSGTAPMPHHESSYGDSILDHYADDSPPQLNRSETSGPKGGPRSGWQR